MIHPHTELRLINPVIGHGLIATARIPKGTITWVRDELDQCFTPAEVRAKSRVYRDVLEKYCFVDGRGRAVLCWDLARFVNHCCNATCLSAGYDFEIAVRDIEIGEELTDDYGTLNIEGPFPCACGKPNCRGEITPEDPIRLADFWDARVRAAFPGVGEVDQPLWDLVREKELVGRALAEPQTLASCRAHFLADRRRHALLDPPAVRTRRPRAKAEAVMQNVA